MEFDRHLYLQKVAKNKLSMPLASFVSQGVNSERELLAYEPSS
jgi:hypothetical protein